MGMKKSVVATRAWSSFSLQTAASSEVSVPTIRLAKGAAWGAPARICCRTPGAILQPQPPPWARLVSRTGPSAAPTGSAMADPPVQTDPGRVYTSAP